MAEDILTCSICIEFFENPKMLPCQHSFCKDCLLSIIEKKPKFNCPLCRFEIVIENDKNAEDLFPTNYLLSTLLESHKRSKDSLVFVHKQTTNSETQTYNRQVKKKTRTIGTEMKRLKTTNVSTQTKNNRACVQDASIQTFESRLKECNREDAQTLAEVKSEDASVNVDIQSIQAETSCDGGCVKQNSKPKHVNILMRCKNSFDFTSVIIIMVMVILKLLALCYKVICFPFKIVAQVIYIFYLARLMFRFISDKMINMVKKISSLCEKLKTGHPLTFIKESIILVISYHFLTYFVSKLMQILDTGILCTVCLIHALIFPFYYADKMQVRPEIKLRRPKMKIIRSRHKIR